MLKIHEQIKNKQFIDVAAVLVPSANICLKSNL